MHEPKRLIPDYVPGTMQPPPPPQVAPYSRERSFQDSAARWACMSIPELRGEVQRLRTMGSSNLALPA